MSEFAASNDIRAGRFSANTFQYRLLRYAVVGEDAIFEGDIVLGSVAEIEVFSRQARVVNLQPEGIAIKGERYRWPDATIPYLIDPALARPERVHEAIDHWRSKTPIQFLELQTGDLNQHADRVLFANRGICSSQVGRRGLEQVISLGDACDVGNAMHEIGHAVGLWHEQSRSDRDRHVTVNRANIEADREHNFNQHVSDGDDIGEYDYGSIMHYPATAFSANGQPTLVARNGAAIGQRQRLSDGDIAAVKELYP